MQARIITPVHANTDISIVQQYLETVYKHLRYRNVPHVNITVVTEETLLLSYVVIGVFL